VTLKLGFEGLIGSFLEQRKEGNFRLRKQHGQRQQGWEETGGLECDMAGAEVGLHTWKKLYCLSDDLFMYCFGVSCLESKEEATGPDGVGGIPAGGGWPGGAGLEMERPTRGLLQKFHGN
jgi:hypothetical protein